jgi:predicted RNA-binding Zn-ribbon protein involved in translation (DUF1610 family)
MRFFGGVSARDREHLLQTVHSLGTTSVAGLSAALSWSDRRTRRTLENAIHWGDGAIDFDPVRRSVAWHSLPSAPPAAKPPEGVRATTAVEAPAPPPLPKAWGMSARCATCQVPLTPTGSGTGYYCPQCGRLSSGRAAAPSASLAPAPAAPPSAPSAPAPPTAARRPIEMNGADRRSQELFAAWVTERPIPCPKCRTSLRHHGVAEYSCPSCGTRIAFEKSSALPATSSPARADPPPLPGPAVR